MTKFFQALGDKDAIESLSKELESLARDLLLAVNLDAQAVVHRLGDGMDRVLQSMQQQAVRDLVVCLGVSQQASCIVPMTAKQARQGQPVSKRHLVACKVQPLCTPASTWCTPCMAVIILQVCT